MQQRLGRMSALVADSAQRGTYGGRLAFIFTENANDLKKKGLCVICPATSAKRCLFVAVVMALFHHADCNGRPRVRRSHTHE